MDRTLKTPSVDDKTDKPQFTGMKNSCSAIDLMKRMRRQATGWKELFAKDTPDKGLLTKIYKELLKLNNNFFSLAVWLSGQSASL